MESITRRYIFEDNPKALEYLGYAQEIFERLPNDFEFEGENVLVSCHHLCSIVKARFQELILHSGHFLGKYPFDHSWIEIEKGICTLDVYPVGISSGPILVHHLIKHPKNYGRDWELPILKEEKYPRQVATLIEMLK